MAGQLLVLIHCTPPDTPSSVLLYLCELSVNKAVTQVSQAPSISNFYAMKAFGIMLYTPYILQ